MKLSRSVGVSLACSTIALAAKIQKPFLILPPSARANKAAVVDIFTRSYDAYKKFAFGHDDVSPVSEGFSDGRNGWGASIIDAMSTMQIMGLNDLFLEAVNFSSQIDFSKSQTPSTVSVFETTIRYVGGLISAYELSGKKHHVLIDKAKEVADKMAFAWTTPDQDVPFGFMDFSTNTPTRSSSNIAEAGTLSLEWNRLSVYTGNDTYRNLTERSLRRIAANADPLPGLAAQGIDPVTGNALGSYVTWGGGSDSYFEYLIKLARLTNTNDNLFADTWHTAVDSSIKSLLKTSTVGNHLYLADFDGTQIRHVGSHLACFYAGNWIMGGKMLNNQTIVDIALKLNEGCWNTYASTATGIGPEAFAFIGTDGNFTGSAGPNADQLAFYQQHGYYITASDYILRPEVLESNFYAYRATGDHKYLDRAASAVKAFNKFLFVNGGAAGLNDVNDANSSKIDDTESFWFAEVLKYLYLTFDDPNHINLDEWVFNTECHPFKAPPPKPVYGTSKLRPWKPFTPTHGGPLPAISSNPFVKIPVPPSA